jgi:hypothetical protein
MFALIALVLMIKEFRCMFKAVMTTDNPAKKADQFFTSLNLALSPAGHLYLHHHTGNEGLPPKEADKIAAFFSQGYGLGLLRLGLTRFNFSLPVDFAFWQEFSQIFIVQACQLSTLDIKEPACKLTLPIQEANALIDRAPFMRGVDYLNREVLDQLFQDLIQTLETELIPFESAGAMVRVPNWCSPKRPPRPTVKVAIGNAHSSNVGLDALLDFNMQFASRNGNRVIFSASNKVG